MDRNIILNFLDLSNVKVALRKESVDRNGSRVPVKNQSQGSLSARRAWIEILYYKKINIVNKSLSARRAWIEMSGHRQAHTSPESLSARRAWIEINFSNGVLLASVVALRKESVDRNMF